MKENPLAVQFNAILKTLKAKANVLQGLNEKIVYQTDGTEIEDEKILIEAFALNIEIKLHEQRT